MRRTRILTTVLALAARYAAARSLTGVATAGRETVRGGEAAWGGRLGRAPTGEHFALRIEDAQALETLIDDEDRVTTRGSEQAGVGELTRSMSPPASRLPE